MNATAAAPAAASAEVPAARTATRDRLRRALEPLRPPLSDRRFWLIQGLVALAAASHHAVEALGLMAPLGTLYFVLISLLLVVPVLLAALYFGRSGAVATGLGSLLLSIPNLIIWHSGGERYGEIFQLVMVNVVAVLLAWWVDAEASARRRAEVAGAALQASEARYRGLFETAAEPVILLDGNGLVQEANAAACRLFNLIPGAVCGRSLPEIGAGALLKSGEDGRPAFAGEVVLRAADGRRVYVEPVCTSLGSDRGLLQVVLRDITRQRRRQSRLEAYTAQVLRAQEEERKRIAQEIHDGVLHDLVLLCRRLDLTGSESDAGPEAAVAAVAEARTLAEDMAHSLRSFARDLRPPVLDDLGLAPAVRWLVTELEAQAGIRAALSIAGEPRRLSSDAELALFRIAQEALRNAARHSGCKELAVDLSFARGEVTLAVLDDGVGFQVPASLHELAVQRKLGVLGMYERARLLDADFDIRSAPGRGAAVTVRLTA